MAFNVGSIGGLRNRLGWETSPACAYLSMYHESILDATKIWRKRALIAYETQYYPALHFKKPLQGRVKGSS
jgi:hypothetical protein